MSKKAVFLLLFLFLGKAAISRPARGPEWLPVYEARLAAAGHDLIECRQEEERAVSLDLFHRYMDTLLQIPGSYAYPLEQVRNVKVLYSPDQLFRIITWLFRFDNDSLVYHGLIQLKDESADIIYLRDSSHLFSEKEPLHKKLSPDNWYGALYYEIIPTRLRGQHYYTLIGWNGSTARTDKKILEVLYFDKKGKPVFGAPLFRYFSNRGLQSRVVWEYVNEGAMVLRYERKKNIITFENLSFPDKKAKGMYHLYLPDGTYDYFRLKKGVWEKNEMLFDTIRGATEE
jgi:hypothetical protein